MCMYNLKEVNGRCICLIIIVCVMHDKFIRDYVFDNNEICVKINFTIYVCIRLPFSSNFSINTKVRLLHDIELYTHMFQV